MAANRHDDHVTDKHGVDIFYHRWSPDAPPVCALHLVHGLGEHLFRYQHVIDHLTSAGIDVWGHHQRGHGLTGQKQWGDDVSKWGRLGPGGMEAVLDNTTTITQMARQHNTDIPLVFLGHSWGSLVGQILLNRGVAHVLDGVVFSGTSYRMPGFMNSGDLNAKHKHLGDTGAEWLSRDVAVHEAFLADPWTFEAKTLKLFGVKDSAKLLGRPQPVGKNLPLLLMVGTDDSLGGEKGTRKLADAYRRPGGLTDITVRVYEGARHEVFNETNKEQVLQDLTTWLHRLLEAHTT
jgi:alpha-beta hydrolase superfamily lysophospholipase